MLQTSSVDLNRVLDGIVEDLYVARDRFKTFQKIKTAMACRRWLKWVWEQRSASPTPMAMAYRMAKKF
jgi:hypothetical protein